MASERYMGVDDRRDHSFRLPRPDLTLGTGSPNACNRCHRDQKPEWAALALDGWFGKAWRAPAQWASAFASAERHSSAAQKPLAALALDRSMPAIVRASALRLWAGVPRALPEPQLLSLVDDAEPLVRAEALPLLAQLPPAERWRRAHAHLDDSDRLVRLEAAELLTGLPPEVTGSEGAQRLQKALTALVLSLEQQADFPANATQLAQVLMRSGDLVQARSWLTHALARDAQFLGAYLASSELERLAGDNRASARVLEQGLVRLPKAAGLYYASGLSLVRLGQKREALARLARATELAPDDANFAYTYGVALQDLGEHGRAVEVLERCLRSQAENGELLEELLRIGLSQHDFALMRRHLPTFEQLFPDDPALSVLRAALQQEGRGPRD
jgi:tetratricopeptide (TPR) repeat protein